MSGIWPKHKDSWRNPDKAESLWRIASARGTPLFKRCAWLQWAKIGVPLGVGEKVPNLALCSDRCLDRRVRADMENFNLAQPRNRRPLPVRALQLIGEIVGNVAGTVLSLAATIVLLGGIGMFIVGLLQRFTPMFDNGHEWNAIVAVMPALPGGPLIGPLLVIIAALLVLECISVFGDRFRSRMRR